MATKKKEETTEIETIPKPGPLTISYGEDEGAGYEHQSAADTRIPIIALCQALSPTVKSGKAKIGDYFNTVTEQVWPGDTGFLFVPSTTRHTVVEWVPRKQGGGYRGQHAVDSDIVKKAIEEHKKDPDLKFGEWYTDDGNELQETFYVFGAICGEDGQAESMALIPFYSSKIRSYKGWMTKLRQTMIVDGAGKRVRPPLYAHLTRFKSEMKNFPEGEASVPLISSGDERGVIQSLLGPDDERFQMAKACKILVDSDQAKVDYSQTKADGDGQTGEKPPF